MHSNRIFNYNDRVIESREDGYINLTQMCKANGKKLNHWLDQKSTKDYIEALSTSTGIPVNLLLEVKQTGLNENRGSWGHPRVAIRLAQWISPGFAVWCDGHIFNITTQGFSTIDDRQQLERTLGNIPSIKDIENSTGVFDKYFGRLYAQQYLLQQVNKHYPLLAGPTPLQEQFEPLPSQEASLTPTQIAKEIGIFYRSGNPNPKQVNILLEKLGYQTKVEKQWSATEKAIKANLCIRVPFNTNSKTQKDQLKWFTGILPILKEFVTA